MKPTLFLLVLLLSACAPVFAPAAAAPTLTPAPTRTSTLTPTITLTPTPSLPIADPDLATSLKKHHGLEASITRETDGRFTAQVALLSPDGAAAPAALDVDPATLTENLALIGKNTYADTPVMIARDGTKLYWIKEYKTWYAKAAEAGSIHAPWRIPYGRPEISARMGIADHPEDFSPSAVERWSKHQYQNALGFQILKQSSRDTWVKMGYLDNMSLGASDLTQENTPVQILPDDWYAMEMPNGTLFRYFQLKWLDPKDPRNPKADEWKIIQAAPGTEITDNEYNRGQFLKLLTWTTNNAPVYRVLPIFKTDEGFFDYATHAPDFQLILQPSLAKLLTMPKNDLANLNNPNLAKWNAEYGTNLKIGFWIDRGWEKVTPAASYLIHFENDNMDYYDNFLPQEIQTLIFPAFVMRR